MKFFKCRLTDFIRIPNPFYENLTSNKKWWYYMCENYSTHNLHNVSFSVRSTGFTFWGGEGELHESLRQIYHRHVKFTDTHALPTHTYNIQIPIHNCVCFLDWGPQDSIAQIAHCWGNICNKFSLWLRPDWHSHPLHQEHPPSPPFVV